MLLLTSALKIAVEKVLSTIYNIIVFRQVYSFIQIWLSGIYAFIAVIYITPRVKNLIVLVFLHLKSIFMPKTILEEKLNAFEKKYLKAIDLEDSLLPNVKDSFLERMKIQSQSDIFSYIFTCSSKSSILNLFTIIGVEYLHSSYEYNIVYSIFCCVFISFVICFGSSFRYSSILSKEWIEFLNERTEQKNNASSKSKNILLVYQKEENELITSNQEFVCLWVSKYNPETNLTDIELKFLSSKYSKNLTDLVEFYAEKYLVLENQPNKPVETNENFSPQIDNQPNEVKAQNYKLFLPEYYDDDMVFSRCIKSKGFKTGESWKEFNIFPLIDIKINTYSNIMNEKNNKKKSE